MFKHKDVKTCILLQLISISHAHCKNILPVPAIYQTSCRCHDMILRCICVCTEESCIFRIRHIDHTIMRIRLTLAKRTLNIRFCHGKPFQLFFIPLTTGIKQCQIKIAGEFQPFLRTAGTFFSDPRNIFVRNIVLLQIFSCRCICIFTPEIIRQRKLLGKGAIRQNDTLIHLIPAAVFQRKNTLRRCPRNPLTCTGIEFQI